MKSWREETIGFELMLVPPFRPPSVVAIWNARNRYYKQFSLNDQSTKQYCITISQGKLEPKHIWHVQNQGFVYSPNYLVQLKCGILTWTHDTLFSYESN